MSKLEKIIANIKGTEVIEGPSKSFIPYYLLTKMTSVIRRKSSLGDKMLRKWIEKRTPPSFVIKNSLGHFRVRPFDDSLTLSSDYFEEELQKWLGRADTKNIFIDIGANIGRYCILSTGTFGYQRVYAFEPNPATAEICKENIKLNKLEEKVTLVEQGLGDTAKHVSFYEDPLNRGGNHVVEVHETGLKVSLITFDEWAHSSSLQTQNVSFIKIDVEGYEYHVLKGMEATLKNLPQGTLIMIEISKRNDEVIMMLNNAGFARQEQLHSDYLFIKQA